MTFPTNLVLSVSLGFLASMSAHALAAGTVTVPGTFGGFQVAVSSMQDMRFRGVVRQRYDFSCGSAVVASLLTHHYGIPTAERQAFERMYAVGDQERIRRLGFSMLDMKRYLTELGLKADGYRLSLDVLEELGVPAIALIETKGYRHFVLVKGVRGNEVLIGDPALGLTRYSRPEFDALRNNDIFFLLRDRMELGRAGFSGEKDWDAVARAPVEAGLLRDSVASFMLALPRSTDW
jgi:predicted double-glycine peptidase